MKLKNNALQELYDTFANGTISFSPYEESPVDKAFRECDEKLQKDIDFWKCGNDILLSAINNIRAELETKVKRMDEITKDRDFFFKQYHALKDDYEKLKARTDCLREELAAEMKAKNDWPNMLVERGKTIASLEERLMETKESLEKANADRTELQKDRDSYHGLYTELRKDYDRLFEENRRLKVPGLINYEVIEKEIEKLKKELTATRKDYDKLYEDNRKLKARTDCLRVEVEWYRKHYKEKSDENKRLQNNVRAGYDQGQTDLWVKLQDVRDVNLLEEFDPECETLGDIIDMDLEDFLDAYKKWQEEKETYRMRKWLTDFCDGRWCRECPLESSEYKCGMGYIFMGVNLIPDKDIKRYYEKARGCGRRPFTKPDDPCSGVREKIKAGLASEVKEVPVSCNIPIKDPTSWECTIEATVEINKDLLEKVCGVKPDNKK